LSRVPLEDCRVYRMMTAPNLHAAAQAPHLMHFSESIACGIFTAPVIAFAGHFLAHAVQPLHFPASIM